MEIKKKIHNVLLLPANIPHYDQHNKPQQTLPAFRNIYGPFVSAQVEFSPNPIWINI